MRNCFQASEWASWSCTSQSASQRRALKLLEGAEYAAHTSKAINLRAFFCGGLVDALVESNSSGDSNTDDWRFLFHVFSILSSFFFLFFFSLFFFSFLTGWHVLQYYSYWWVAIFLWYVLVGVSPQFSRYLYFVTFFSIV